MKKLFPVILMMILLVTCPVLGAAGIPDPPQQFYCLDEGEILSAELEGAIVSSSADLAKKCGAQIVVVTLDTLGDQNPEDVALEILRSWGIGDRQKNNGVLILITLQERQSRIEVGYGLEGVLPDGKVGRILDENLVPYFKQGNYNLGILNTYNAVLKEVSSEYNLPYQPLDPYSLEIPRSSGSASRDKETNWWVVFIILLILYLSFRFRGKGGGGGGYRGGGGPFWGGPWGGGGSFGGRGGFGGGGGSGGGGGAGRGW